MKNIVQHEQPCVRARDWKGEFYKWLKRVNKYRLLHWTFDIISFRYLPILNVARKNKDTTFSHSPLSPCSDLMQSVHWKPPLFQNCVQKVIWILIAHDKDFSAFRFLGFLNKNVLQKHVNTCVNKITLIKIKSMNHTHIRPSPALKTNSIQLEKFLNAFINNSENYIEC